MIVGEQVDWKKLGGEQVGSIPATSSAGAGAPPGGGRVQA